MCFVGASGGRLWSQRHVALLASSPYSCGWIIWLGLRNRVDKHPTGFSIATESDREQADSHKAVAKLIASSVKRALSGRRLFQWRPEEDK